MFWQTYNKLLQDVSLYWGSVRHVYTQQLTSWKPSIYGQILINHLMIAMQLTHTDRISFRFLSLKLKPKRRKVIKTIKQ